MCSRPSAFMAMTPPSVSWRRASARPGGSGLMCGMTGPSPGLRRRRRSITPRAPDERRAVRQEKSKPLLEDMHVWLLRERENLSRSSEVLKPINYMLRRWDDFARFLDEGRICLTNNCAERALRGIALGRRNWTFAGSQRGADRAAIMLTMITTCRLNDVDAKAWLADFPPRLRLA